MEIMYQCPVCDAYVQEGAERCKCGAIFDSEDEDTYLCPQCGCEVEPDSDACPQCDTKFE